jgi:hypothetical protein
VLLWMRAGLSYPPACLVSRPPAAAGAPVTDEASRSRCVCGWLQLPSRRPPVWNGVCRSRLRGRQRRRFRRRSLGLGSGWLWLHCADGREGCGFRREGSWRETARLDHARRGWESRRRLFPRLGLRARLVLVEWCRLTRRLWFPSRAPLDGSGWSCAAWRERGGEGARRYRVCLGQGLFLLRGVDGREACGFPREAS